MTPTLVIMVKEPRPGRVKTRLGRGIGLTKSAWWFRHQSRALLRRLRDPRWQIVLAVAPDTEGLTSRVWPADMARIPQGRGNLGDRMGRIFRHAGIGPLCIIGADIPGIDRLRIARAFKALGTADTVFGPAPDGGYWLIGLARRRALPSTILQDVRWSSPHALSDSRRALPQGKTTLIDTLQDIDTRADLTEMGRDARPRAW
jgi:rSAM/selenodomain-associated transferase 1